MAHAISPVVPATQGHGEKQSRKREQAIAALLDKPTVGAAAKAAGIGERTLRTWLKDPKFRADYQIARRRLVDDAVRELQGSCKTAARALNQIVGDADLPAANRISAAKVIFDSTLKGMEALEFAERIEKLEAALAEREREAARGA